MESKQKAGSKIKWVADRIQEKFYMNPLGNVIQYDIAENEKNDFIPSYRDQLDILRKMEKRGVIVILNSDDFKKYLSENPSESKPSVVKIKIQKEEFEKFRAGYEGYTSNDTQNKDAENSLKNVKVSFDNNKAQLILGEVVSQLPPYRNEHLFCKAMFEYPAQEPVDWSDVYEKMFGQEFEDAVKNKRTVYDAMENLNSRVQEMFATKDKLFSSSNNTIIRHF